MMGRLVSAGLLLLAAGCARSAPAPVIAPPPAENAEAERLMLELGDANLDVREWAHRALWEMGAIAEAALRAHLHDPDPEVAERCVRILRDLPIGDWEWYVASIVDGIDLQSLALLDDPRHGMTYAEIQRMRFAMDGHGVTCVRLQLAQASCNHGDMIPSSVTAERALAPAVKRMIWETEGASNVCAWLGRVARRSGADVELLPGGEAHFLSRRAAFDRWWSEGSCRYYRAGERPHEHR